MNATLRGFLWAFIAVLMLSATMRSGLAAVDDVKLRSAQISVAQNAVSGAFKLENPAGTGAMQRLSLLEMSIRKPGGAFLALFGSQEMCDPTHPENVNKRYLLADGEIFTLSLATQQLPDGEYEVWCESANACYADDPDAFRSEGPCAGGMKLAELDLRTTTNAAVLEPSQPEVGTGGSDADITVEPGDIADKAAVLWKAVGLGTLLFLAGILIFFPAMPAVGVAMAIGGVGLIVFGLFGGG